MLALLNDLPIMTIAYDHARIERQPVRWNFKEVLTLYAGFIWAYALVWFVFNDFLKVAVYRMLHRTKWLLGREHVHESIE